jgi:integrase
MRAQFAEFTGGEIGSILLHGASKFQSYIGHHQGNHVVLVRSCIAHFHQRRNELGIRTHRECAGGPAGRHVSRSGRGVDLTTVQQLLGHARITMTARYAHSASDTKIAAVARLD